MSKARFRCGVCSSPPSRWWCGTTRWPTISIASRRRPSNTRSSMAKREQSGLSEASPWGHRTRSGERRICGNQRCERCARSVGEGELKCTICQHSRAREDDRRQCRGEPVHRTLPVYFSNCSLGNGITSSFPRPQRSPFEPLLLNDGRASAHKRASPGHRHPCAPASGRRWEYPRPIQCNA